MFTPSQPVGLVQRLREPVRAQEGTYPAVEREPRAGKRFIPGEICRGFPEACLDIGVELFANALDLGNIQRCGRGRGHDDAQVSVNLEHPIVIRLRHVPVVNCGSLVSSGVQNYYNINHLCQHVSISKY